MAQRKGRPPSVITIADCASAVIVSNPTPLCGHGKFWRESSWGTAPDDVRARVCQEPGCEATEFVVHAGESVTFKVARTIGERSQMLDGHRARLEAARAPDGSGSAPAVVDVALDLAAERITGWTWTGPDGEVLPLPSANREAVRNALEASELLWLAEAILIGADPKVAPVIEGNGGAGSQQA